jgi:hypothetical protein
MVYWGNTFFRKNFIVKAEKNEKLHQTVTFSRLLTAALRQLTTTQLPIIGNR